ncbi:MAG: hypothetical protein M3A44_07295 [Gammaproteobacteria bacterium]
MNDEQRRLAPFGAQPGGTGRFCRETALHLAYVRQVRCAWCALSRGKSASVAAVQ